MSDTSFPYNETTNLGFITNPNIQDASLKANDRREQWLLGAYHYANSDRDEASRKASSAIFGDGTIPLSDKENSAYFLGDAILREHGYTGSPLQYFYANKLDLPPDVTDEATARIHIGNKLINEMRATYNERKKIEQDFAAIQNDLPTYLAQAVRMPSGYTGELPNKEIASILGKAGAWTKMRPSVERARLAWLRMQHAIRNIDTMQSLTRGDLLELANELSDENGKLDELAMLAFSTALQQYATEQQSTDINFFENWADSLQNVNAEKQDSKLRESKEGSLERLELLARTVEIAKENGMSTEVATRMYEREVAALKDDRVNRLRGLMNAAMNIAMEPSEQASTLAKVLSSGGTLAGGMILPMVGSIAAGVLAKGKGGGFFSQAAAGYAGGFAASQDFIVNQAVMQAYFEGKENPETYGHLSGTGQAAAENVFGTGTSAFFLFKGVSKLATKAAAKSVTNKAFSNAIARGTLAYFGTTAIEGTGELMEEELGAYLGSKLNQLARATGTKVSEQEYTAWKTISEMPAHQVAAIYGMAAVLGIGGGIANYQKAQAWSMNVDNLRQSGFSDKAARDIVADGILHAEKVEEVKNSDRPEEEKQLLLTNLQDERLEYLGKQFNKDILHASPEELNTRSKEENAQLLYKMLLAQSIKNGLDEQTLVNLGFTTSERQPNGNYLLTYLEPAEGENAQPKLVQKEWNRDQLTGFLTYQQDTAIHKQLRELQSQIVAQQFAHSVESTSELAIRLANLRDTPLTELAAIRKHMAITIDLFREFARKEAANIAADVSAGMPLTQAEQQPSTILPNVARGSVLQLAEKAEARIENAIATGEIKPGQPVHFPGINISALDGSGLVAFFSGKINLAQMLEEMFEIRLKQLRSTEYIQGMADTLKAIQSKLPGVKLLPGNKTTYTKDDIIEAYSHLAVAEVITNPAYYSHLTQAEQALINDVLANVNRAHKYKIIADAWQTYKNSDEGKAYLQQSGKDLMDIMQEAGFTFGKHFTTVQATEEQKTKLLAEHNFIPDFSQQTNRLLENAQAQQELEKQNQQEATEPTTIPASESVTGEEIVVTPEEKEAVEEPVQVAEPITREEVLQKMQSIALLNPIIESYQRGIEESSQKIELLKAKEAEQGLLPKEKEALAREEKGLTNLQNALAEKQEELNKLKAEVDNALTQEQHKGTQALINKLRTPAATYEDFLEYFKTIPYVLDSESIQLGFYVKDQNGEANPAYEMAKAIALRMKSGLITTKADIADYITSSAIEKEIIATAGENTTSGHLQQRAEALKQKAKEQRNEARKVKEKLDQAQNAGGKIPAPEAPAWPKPASRKTKVTQEQVTEIVATTASKEKSRYVLTYVSKDTIDGVTTYVATDGRRLSYLSRKARAEEEDFTQTLISPATNEEGNHDRQNYPNWRQVVRASFKTQDTIDLAPLLALKKIGKRAGKLPYLYSSSVAIHHVIEIDIAGETIRLNAAFMREIVEQVAALTKTLGFSPTVNIGFDGNGSAVTFWAEHNGWEWKHVIMPVQKKEGAETKADKQGRYESPIVYSNGLYIQGADTGKTASQIDDLQKQYDIAGANARDFEEEVARLKTLAKDIELLEQKLPKKEQLVRWVAGHYKRPDYNAIRKLLHEVESGDVSRIAGVLTSTNGQEEVAKRIFEEISGIKLTGTPEENKAAAEEWATKRKANTATTEQDGGNFSVEELEKNGEFENGILQTSNAIITSPNFSIEAMHVSPHNFRKFSTDFMGSGEGAQAYGWGLYFAEDEGVNKKYFNDFSNKRDTYLFDGKPMSRADIVALFADAFEQIDKEYNAPKSAKDIAHTILWDLRGIQGGIKGAYSRQSALIEKRKKQQERNTFGVTNNLIKSSLAAHDVLKLLAEHDIQTHPATNYRVELNADDTNLLMWDERYSGQEIKDLLGEELFGQIYDEADEEATLLDNGEGIYMLLRSVFGSKEAASKKLQEHGVKGIKYLDGNSRSAGEGTYNYVIFSGDDIKITSVNETGVWSMSKGWEPYNDPTANFSIAPMDDLGLRFAGEPIAVRMMNYIRDEGKRYSRNLGNKTSHDTAVNAIAHAQSIIGALDKYINTTKKPIRAADRARLGLLQRLIEKYAQIIKKGSTRSFAKIDPHEQEELIAAIQEAGAGIDWEAIEAIPTEEYNRIQQEVQNDLLPELYRKHAAAFANNLSAESYSTPADIRERMQALQQAAQTGHPNKNITPQDLTDSGYNSQPSADLKRDVLKQYANAQLTQLQNSEEQNRKEFENAKTRTLQALQRIIKEGRLAENSTLGQAEQQQLTDAVEQEAQAQTEKETRKRVLDTYREQIKRDTEERYKQLVRTAAKGRVYQLLSEMLQDAGDILDNHLKADLVQKMKRITKSVAIKRTASKKLKGKLTAAGYRELQQAILLMDMSARAKDDVLDDIDISTIWLTTYAGKDIDTLRKGTDLLKELADLIEREGGTVTEANLNIALNNYRNAVLVFADLDSKNYMQTLQAANALALLINHHKSTWAALQERRTAEMKAYLDYFLANTTETSGTDNAIRKAVEKAKTIITFLPDTMMNTAQLFAALASYPALKPIFDDMRYNLANAQTAREVHLRNIRQQELAAFGRIIGMQPFNEAGYSEKQLQEISDKFDTFFMENNQVKPTDISITLFKDGKEHTYKWEGTKWEALGLILTYRQQHYQTNAQIHGYTPAVLEALQNHIGEKLMSFGNAIQQIIVNDGTIAVYEEREGVPMQENPLYFPGNININTINTTREEPLTSPYHPTAMHDFLHVRVKNTDEAKAKNAYLTYRSAIADRANYIYLDPITTNIDRLLAHRDFTNRLASLIGPNLHKQLIKTIKEIKGAGYQETSLQDMTDSRLSQALSSSVLTLLPFNIGSYARQFSAVANAGLMPDISPVALVQYALKIRNDQGHISIPGILKLDAFTTRRRDNAFVNEVASMENNVKFSHLLKWTKTGLNWMDKLDVLANAFSAAIVYNHKYDQLKTMGELSEEDITKLCEQEVNACVRLLAQPLNRVDKSALYWSLSGSALTRCLLFMGSESINKIGMLRSNYISAINTGRGHIMASLMTIAKIGVTVGLGNFVIESMLALLSGNAPDDKDDSLAAWLTAQYLNAAIGQYLDIMPVFGQFTRKLFNPYAKVGFKDLNIPGTNIDTYGVKLYKMLTDDKDYSGAEWQRQTTNFLREFTSILGYAGGAYSKWQIYSHVSAVLHNITAAFNVGNIIARGAENGAFYADWLPEDYTKTNRRKRKRLKSGIERMLTPDSDTDSSDTPTPLNISPELLKDYPDLAPYLRPKS